MFSKFFQANESQQKVADHAQEIIRQKLNDYRSTSFASGVLNVCQLHGISLNKKIIEVKLTVPFPCQSEFASLAQELTQVLGQTLKFLLELNVIPVRKHSISGIKNIIAIASGKGGVGKSTTAVNLAYALMAEGAKVGILDADIYGPSIPLMLGLQGIKPTSSDGKLITPLESHGLSAMSIGFLVDEKDATVWRGPMASRAFDQLLNETAWQDLDYLIVDMPPGTGDIQLTLGQKMPVAAAVIITTPQDIALADAVKGIAMFAQVKVPVLGIIENMSYHLCSHCGHQSSLFGKGGGEKISTDHQVSLLGQLPLDITIRQAADTGDSPLISNITGELAKQYRKIATTMAAKLFNQYDARSPETTEILIKEL